MQNTKERITIFLKHKGIGQAKFAEVIGVSKGYVNNMTGNPTQNILSKIGIAYPELNTNWLATGEGEMLKQSSEPVPIQNTDDKNYKELWLEVLQENIELLKELNEIKTKQLESKKEKTSVLVNVKGAKSS